MLDIFQDLLGGWADAVAAEANKAGPVNKITWKSASDIQAVYAKSVLDGGPVFDINDSGAWKTVLDNVTTTGGFLKADVMPVLMALQNLSNAGKIDAKYYNPKIAAAVSAQENASNPIGSVAAGIEKAVDPLLNKILAFGALGLVGYLFLKNTLLKGK